MTRKDGGTRGSARSGAARACAGMLTALMLIAGAAAPGSAQGLADYDYDQLSFRGLGAWIGGAWPTRVESTTTFGVRADLGYAGPGVRIMPHVGYWSSTMNRSEVSDLETRVEELLEQQDPPVSADVDLGTIDWSDLIIGLDAQFVWAVPFDVLTYAGAGFAAHVTNGSGPGIDGTFVEDLIDSFSAGINVHGGLEYLATDRLRVFAEARYELLADLRYSEIRAGMSFYLSEPATGEERGR